MVYLVKKKLKNNTYLYFEHRKWEDNKSVRAFSIYLGAESKLIKNPKRLRLFDNENVSVDIYDFGLPAILTRIVDKLDLIDIINQCTGKRNQGRSVGEFITLATINRCVQPSSKAKLQKWFNSSYLQSIFPNHDQYLDSMAYVNHFKYLDQDTLENIELKLAQKLQEEFGIKMDQLMYDPSNLYTYINPKKENQQLAKHGKSKEGRNTLNLVAISLFCTRDEGIPIMHNTYSGNIQDATHFKNELPRFLKRMEKLGIEDSSITLVFDKGNISEDAFGLIDESQLTWISSVRPSSHKDLHELVSKDFTFHTLPNGKEVGIKDYTRKMHKKDRRLIVCYNEKQQEWNAHNLQLKIQSRVKAVNDYFDGKLNIKKWRSKKAVITKIESLIGKKHSHYIDFQVTGSYAKLKYSITIKTEYTEEIEQTLGKSYFMTNDLKSPSSEIIWHYRQQYTVERAFSYLKGPEQIRIRPMYHHIDSSIRGHIFTCVLALLLLSLLEKEVRLFEPNLSQPTIIELLKEMKVARISLSEQEPSFDKIANMSKEAKNLYQQLNLVDLFNV